MDVKTRFDIGDKVFFMKDNEIASDFVDWINIEIPHSPYGGNGVPKNSYLLKDTGLCFVEMFLFSSAEELAKKLVKKSESL